MRIQTLSKTLLPLLGLTCLLVIVCSGVARGQDSNRPVVATVAPQGNDFRVQFDEVQVSKIYPQYVAAQRATGRAIAIKTAEFKRGIQQEALGKLRTLFPNGVPPDAASKIKISIFVTFKPPGAGIWVEW
jgi:hypothetical protein